MGGGKSRALCEEVLDLSLEHPRLRTLVARLRHTSIIETTKKTMIEEVIPVELLTSPQTRRKESGGEDYLQLPNGSRIHFVGLEDPVKWFSAELGLLVIDEAHEVPEDTVVKLMTRLRQRGMPNRVMIGFNPENPGHWLQRWFILGASQTDHGFYKRDLYTTGASSPIGDAEFVIAKAVDNPFLPSDYVDVILGGQPELLRRRYRDGEWLFTSGRSFFDVEALTDYEQIVGPPRWVGYTAGSNERLLRGLTAEQKRDPSFKGPIRVKPGKEGPLQVWEAPVRERYEDGKKQPAHRYVLSADVSSGTATDYSGIQVIDVDDFSQVAEYQAKVDPDLLAVEAFRLGRIYNDATIAPETTGGYGFSVLNELKRLGYGRLYTRPAGAFDRLARKFTDQLGWDTSTKTRMVMLDTLERVLREREFGLRSVRTLTELATFVRDDAGRPAAQVGCNDDLVVSLSIAVMIATQLPRQLRPPPRDDYQPMFASTGY